MKLNRRYEQGAEFRQRQGQFDFAEVALAVLDIAVYVAKEARKWFEAWRPKVAQVMMRRPQQLVLELDSIAQAPIFSPL